jgi:hypothetical protein
MIYPKRCYLDTSVIGGYYDPEFAEATQTLFEEIRGGKVKGMISNIDIEELNGAPKAVRDLVHGESKFPFGIFRETVESERLAEAYLESGIVSGKFLVDCRHVALASVERVDLLLSWNCRHIVHYDKIRLFNAVNIIRGYDSLEIRTPSEVIDYG